MPKSKREKQISLTRTQKKGLELKQDVIKKVRDACDKYARVFVVRVENMRNNKLKEVREEWHHSKFFFGKNKVMAFALGETFFFCFLDKAERLYCIDLTARSRQGKELG